jgi:hypothetical protein
VAVIRARLWSYSVLVLFCDFSFEGYVQSMKFTGRCYQILGMYRNYELKPVSFIVNKKLRTVFACIPFIQDIIG